LKSAAAWEGLFSERFLQVEAQGHVAHKGLVNASLVKVPRQRNTRQESAQVKAGGVPAGWVPEAASSQGPGRALDPQERREPSRQQQEPHRRGP